MSGRNCPDSISFLKSFIIAWSCREAEQDRLAGQQRGDERQERVLAARAQLRGQVHPARFQQPPAPAE